MVVMVTVRIESKERDKEKTNKQTNKQAVVHASLHGSNMNTTAAFRPIEYAKDTRPRTHRLGDFLRGIIPTVGLDGRWREERADGDDVP